MKRRPFFLSYSIISIILGVFLLILAWSTKAGLEVDFSQKYLLVFYAGLGLILLVTSLNLIVLARQLQKDQDKVLISQERIVQWLDRRWVKSCLIGIFSVIGLGAGQMLMQIPVTEHPQAKALILLNQYFLIWLIAVSVISLLLLAILLDSFRSIWKSDLIIPILIFLVLLIMIAGIDLSPYGFQNRNQGGGNFRLTGFPVLDYQLILVWILSMAGLGISYWWGRTWLKDKKISPVLIDCLIGVVLFLVSFLIWRSAPIIPNAFIDQPRPPNFQYYPNLDAVIYDRTALSLLATGKMQTYIGAGDALWTGRRPLLALFLAGLHWLSGGDYSRLTLIQLGFFSLMPVLVYLFTKTLHNRFSGVLTAGIIIIRSLNGIWLQENVWGGTSLHMLMSDIPAMMFVILFLYLGLLWIKNSRRGFLYPLICGAVLGLGMLIRQELVVLFFVVGLVGFIYYKKKFGWLVGQLSLMLAGLVLVITPWVTRNYLGTGKIYLDKPSKAIDRIAETLPFVKSIEVRQGNPETSDDLIQNNGQDIQELGDDPGPLTAFANHYANAIPQLFLYLPSNPVVLEIDYLWRLVNNDLERNYGGVLYSPYSYSKSLPYWWWNLWDGKLSLKSWIPLAVNLSLIAVGIYQVWKWKRWEILVPILAVVGMVSAYVLIRGSGGRWLQTVDWISAMFLSIGLVQLTMKNLIPGLNAREDISISHRSSAIKSGINWGRGAVLGLLFLIGLAPVVVEAALPNPYTEIELQNRLTELREAKNTTLSLNEKNWLEEFLSGGGEALYGEVLYPRYFPEKAELMSNNQTVFPSSTTFTVAGTELRFVVLPRAKKVKWFPQRANALVIGCRESSLAPDPGFPCLGCTGGEFEAAVVIIYSDDNQPPIVYWRDGEINQLMTCPFRE